MAKILIKGGRVIDPASGFDATADVLLADGFVRAIETTPGRLTADGAEVLDAEGLIVAPGLIDIHVHLREPGPNHDETIASGTAAAVAGGFSTVCCMPNTKPALDDANQVRFVQHQAAQARSARVFVVGCATVDRQGEQLAEIGSMAQAGAVAFSDDGDVVADASMMQQVLQMVQSVDSCFMQHCQEPTLTQGAAMNAGSIATRLGLGGWPAIAEELIIERDIRLNQAIGCRYHAQHLSSGGSVPLIRAAQSAGLPVSGEASPHHLLLTDEACLGYNTMAKMNPPLRSAADITALKEAIADGTITMLATDHAPHPAHTKATDFAAASFGIVGLDCALPLYARALIEDGVIGWPQMLSMMTINGARLVGLDRRGLGQLAVDGPGDITIIDPERSWTIDASAFASTGRNCPFDGWNVKSRAVATIVGGELRHLDGQFCQDRSVAH